jgi:hypothetical protein
MELLREQDDYFAIFKNAYENFNRMRLLIANQLIDSGLAVQAWDMKLKGLPKKLADRYEAEKSHFRVDLYITTQNQEIGIRFASDTNSDLESLDEPVVKETGYPPYVPPEYLQYKETVEKLVDIMQAINADVLRYDALVSECITNPRDLRILETIKQTPKNYLFREDSVS